MLYRRGFWSSVSCGRFSSTGPIGRESSNGYADNGLERRNRLDDPCVGRDPEKRRREMSGFMLSALIGLAALVVGLVILHFTPDDTRRPTRSSRP